MKDRQLQELNTYLTCGNADMQTASRYVTDSGYISVFSRSSPDLDKSNEDRIGIFPLANNSLVLIVADSVGGYIDGAVASSIVINEIRSAIDSDLNNSSDLRESILKGIDNANQSIIMKTSGAASTVAVVEIQGTSIRTYHAGDSEILITGQKGKIKHQTLIHSPVGYALEAGLLGEEEAIMHEERHIVSNVLGFPDMHLSMGVHSALARYDTLLIRSDGLFDNLQKNEIVELIRKGPLASCSQALITEVTARMVKQRSGEPSKSDDMSFILFRLKQPS